MIDSEIIRSFGANNLAIINRSIQRAYALAEVYLHDSALFRIPSALPVKQLIRNLAVDLTLEQDCASGRLKMKHIYQPNRVKNHFHTELIIDDKILTFSSIESGGILPRTALFREKYALTNQISFDDPSGERTLKEPCYGIITHKENPAATNSCVAFLTIPDEEYGCACNHIPLDTISVPSLIPNYEIPSDEDFGFELLPTLKNIVGHV